MRIYHGGPSPNAVHRCRQAAPSHVHGACWTPQKMTPHEWPYFVDNGAFTANFDLKRWVETLDEALAKMPYPPDFVVLPDAYNDAEATLERHRQHVPEVLDRGLSPAPVLQPGLDETLQVELYSRLGADTLFVGGANDWKKAHGRQILDEAHERDLRVHIGNPGGKDELLWWSKAGADSVDTSSIVQNQYWHWLEALEDTPLTDTPHKKASRQGKVGEFASATGGGSL